MRWLILPCEEKSKRSQPYKKKTMQKQEKRGSTHYGGRLSEVSKKQHRTNRTFSSLDPTFEKKQTKKTPYRAQGREVLQSKKKKKNIKMVICSSMFKLNTWDQPNLLWSSSMNSRKAGSCEKSGGDTGTMSLPASWKYSATNLDSWLDDDEAGRQGGYGWVNGWVAKSTTTTKRENKTKDRYWHAHVGNLRN